MARGRRGGWLILRHGLRASRADRLRRRPSTRSGAFGGRLAGAGEDLLAGISEAVYRRSLPLATQHLRIAVSTTGAEAAVRGAIALAIEHALSADVLDEQTRALA